MTPPPVGTNRLGDEASPYLQQHADNPVHWHPWDDHALAQARSRDVPIFLSIGYAACHWCHVMEDESFQDETVASVLNDQYVPIKVDREERPDLDRIYQTICQLVTHSGGWPLSVWLTPSGKPFYVGTYFPKSNRRGRPGFIDLLTGLAETWENDRAGIEDRADQWMAAIRDEVETIDTPTTEPTPDLLVTTADSAVRSADPEHGGFGTSGPKFPQPTRIEVLLQAGYQTGTESYHSTALAALDAMQSGGLFDHVGGGFHRYTVDSDWTVPHFEKMLYDNAELARVYLHGYQLTDDEQYAKTVRDTLEFVRRELTHPDGGFFSTLDAQSDGQEGAFYVWTPDELRDAIQDQTTADIFIDRFGVTGSGDVDGNSVLTVTTEIPSLADNYDCSPEEITTRLETATNEVFDERATRNRPGRDEKILAGWNGLMISACAEAGIVFSNDTYRSMAKDALSFVREHHWDGTRLARRYRDDRTGITGYLDDYAYLARGALDGYQVTGEVSWLAFALDLAETIVDRFWDPDQAVLYFTPSDADPLAARPQELTDQSTPSSTGVAIDTLLALAHFTPTDRFESVAESALETYAGRITATPLQHASLALAANRYTTGSRELTIVADTPPSDWLDSIGATYLPNRLLSTRPPALDGWLDTLGIDTVPPIWADRTTDDGPTIYACQSFTCSPPTTSIAEALSWFDSQHTNPSIESS